MNSTINSLWNKILENASKISTVDEDIVLYRDSEKLFKDNFIYYHELVSEKYMKNSEEELDRHKIAAITICSILAASVLGIKQSAASKYAEQNNFLANEKLALNTALSYMHSELLKEIASGEALEVITKYQFPKPRSCNRAFDEVWCRDLYFSKKYFSLNPINIAKDLFVIEEYTFMAAENKRLKDCVSSHKK